MVINTDVKQANPKQANVSSIKRRCLSIGVMSMLIITGCSKSSFPVSGISDVSDLKHEQLVTTCSIAAQKRSRNLLTSVADCLDIFRTTHIFYNCKTEKVMQYENKGLHSSIAPARLRSYQSVADYLTKMGYHTDFDAWLDGLPKVKDTAGTIEESRADRLAYTDDCQS